ncbi:Peptide-N4-(N-acetyl-beta-glucosaminyl)asparagine amidase A [Hibiscus syriacus]|uniref:Peptide-N4-(N-acetyl-beta-glucosaminyl)asparagine amidase A n=1 Tax=Hibiscus syriacus TaxID=106335 RepID=A0A6A3BA09_HIBSY|nr:Peptide-N4-(N-acetyl-beta-glucosaminyl)asparagine amidase A [Hibiscus syriacus]
MECYVQRKAIRPDFRSLVIWCEASQELHRRADSYRDHLECSKGCNKKSIEKAENLTSGFGSEADLIVPFSRNLPLNDGLRFEIENSSDVKVREFDIPLNVYRAVLEVEVVISLDGEVVGAVWPFTVVYTGGINPLFWRTISGICSFDLPSYDIEISPFLGNLLDGKMHELSFSVTNALNVCYVDANLHLWLDSKSGKTEGKLLQHHVVPLDVSSVFDFKGLNGTFVTNTTRFVSSTGWVKSTYGTFATKYVQDLRYSNTMVMAKDGNLQIVNQTIRFDDSVYAKLPASNVESKKSLKRFRLSLYTDNVYGGNGTQLMVTNVTLGFNEKMFKDADAKLPTSLLRNLQEGNGVIVVKYNVVISGVGSTQQSYDYNGDKFCYSRNISSSNYIIVDDEVRKTCNERSKTLVGYGLTRWWP